MTHSPDPAPRRAPPPIPVSVLTGFLGAGKTTLLNRLLPDPALAGTVVIINEFGEIGLDHLMVETANDDMLVLASGCLCCTIRGDLVSTLEDLLRRRDNGRMAPFRRVVIETTGLADPAPVLQTIMAHRYLAMRYGLDSVVTLVDALNGARTLDAQPEAVKQIAVADRLVLTKTDLVEGAGGAADLDVLLSRLKALNPGAPILDVQKGEATAAALFDAGPYDPSGKIPDVRRWLAAEAYGSDEHGHAHGAHSHAHDRNRHDAHIGAVCLRGDDPVAPAALDLFFGLLRERYGSALLRVKGIVAVADDPHRPLIVHGVQHMFYPPTRLPGWPDRDRSTRIVCIGRDLPAGAIEQLWRAFTGMADVDQPDSAALTANPLAPRAGGLLG